MKYIRTFEKIQNKPKLYDYVLCNDSEDNVKLHDWIYNNPGQIIYIDYKQCFGAFYYVLYNNIPKPLKKDFKDNNTDNCRMMYDEEIIFFSPDKEKVEQYKLTQKYNL